MGDPWKHSRSLNDHCPDHSTITVTIGPLSYGAAPHQVIIAGAGGAAHLPGMVAALTPLPVL